LQALNTDVDGDFPLINRALYGYYPPGSTFKIVTASALLANANADFTTNCAHVAARLVWKADGTTYARRRIVDDEGERAHGTVGLTEAVSESCNIYFARAGIELGPTALRETADKFGFSKLPAARFFGQELPDIAYGQGPMLTTPLEMAIVAMTVAANGERLETHYLKESLRKVLSNPLPTEDAQRLAEMMRRVTISGTAAGRFSGAGYSSVAGKTGTAQNDRYDKMSHSWFIGFAPVDKPEIAFAVIVENGGYGSAAAVPIARELLEAYSRRK
jgi:penicillin-binding protein A